jgi:SSS family solute:Na+ symporter
MMATFYLFVICSAILVIISLKKPQVHTAESAKLVWTSPLEAVRGKFAAGALDFRIVAAALFVAMVILYVVFA